MADAGRINRETGETTEVLKLSITFNSRFLIGLGGLNSHNAEANNRACRARPTYLPRFFLS